MATRAKSDKSAVTPEGVALQEAFGKEVAKARGSRTQSGLATEAGIDQGGWSKIEKGKQWVSADYLARISKVLGVEPFRLFGGLPKMMELPSPESMALARQWDTLTPDHQRTVAATMKGLAAAETVHSETKPMRRRRAG